MVNFLQKPAVALSTGAVGLVLIIIGTAPFSGSFRAVIEIVGNFLFILGFSILLRRVLRW